MEIQVHPLSLDPTAAWEQLSKTESITKIDQSQLKENEIANDLVRIVCISDTHSKTSEIQFNIPNGDILVHAGDFTSNGSLEQVEEFNNWLGGLPQKYKIVIAGNHEYSFDNGDENAQTLKSKLTNCIYLEDSSVVVLGIKFHGSPWQPLFEKPMAFKVRRGSTLLRKWNMIPNNIDILITHVPPLGRNDLSSDGLRAGCVELFSTVRNRVKPKYHIFGHIHEGYGVCSDGITTYINASTCTAELKPINVPIVFDMPLPNKIVK